MSYIIAFLAGAVAGFVAGFIVAKNNANKVAKVQDIVAAIKKKKK